MKLSSTKIASGLASYDISKQLGEGGAGVVFQATRDDGTQVAIKVLKPDIASRAKLKRFRNELSFCFRTEDPHIIRVLDYGQVETDRGMATFYVMPRLAGTLRDQLRKGVNGDQANQLTGAMLDAVEAAHLRRVWHRDLKPENFLIGPEANRLVLSDFGAAHFHADQLLTSIETGPGDRLANFEYAAPEQRRKGSVVDHRCDLYSIGLMIHELFTGEVPHGKGHRTIAEAAQQFDYLDDIVTWLTQQAPERRPGSIDEVRAKLLALNKEVTARRKLSSLENAVITRVESDDPLIADPPRLIDFDIQGNTLQLRLSKAVTSQWVAAFRGISYGSALMGGAPENFRFSGDSVSVSLIYNEPDAATFQRIIDDFKRFLPMGASAYASGAKAELRRAEAEALRQNEARIRAERARLDILKQIKI
jgi:serine/threonine protein kinase